jgi:hypothetical protein
MIDLCPWVHTGHTQDAFSKGYGRVGFSQRLNKELVRASAHGVSAGMVSELAGGSFGGSQR